MARKKQKRNITGLQNQPNLKTLSTTDDEDDLEGWNISLRFDGSVRPCWEMVSDDSESEDSEVEQLEEDWSDLHVEGLQAKMMTFAIDCGDDPRDEDWVPANLRRRKREKKGSVFLSVKQSRTYFTFVLQFAQPRIKKVPTLVTNRNGLDAAIANS